MHKLQPTHSTTNLPHFTCFHVFLSLPFQLEEFLYLNLPQFINYNSNPKYTAHRQTLNQQLLDQFLWIADYHGYVFDQRDLTVTKLWSRIFEFFHIVAHQQQQQELGMGRSFRPHKSVSECIH